MYSLEVVPGLFQITVRYANMFLAVEKSLTLIDAGFVGSIPPVLDFIRKLGRSPEEIGLVVLTHNHLDHAGGVGELRKVTKARVVAHRADVLIPVGATPYPTGHFFGRILRTPISSSFRRFLVLGPDGVTDVVEGGEVLDVLGGMEVVPTPGHTAGSISLYLRQHKLLMVGDALNRRGGVVRLPVRSVSQDMKQAAESVRRMTGLDVRILCFGHGRPIALHAQEGLQALVGRIQGGHAV